VTDRGAASAAQLVVRPYEVRDEAQVVALWREVFPATAPWHEPGDTLSRKLAVQPELLLVGDLGNRVVATAAAGFDGVRGWVHLVAVAPDCRRRGFGARMMREVEQRLAALGCPKLNLQVRGDNARVVGFYRAIGYDVEDRVSLGKPLGRFAG